jgi:hypothetical protein
MKQFNNVKTIRYDEEENACMETITINGVDEEVKI